jgi:hypothetical protein
MELDRSEYDHPTWYTAASTFASYGLILLVMFVLLFVVPYLVFLFLG